MSILPFVSPGSGPTAMPSAGMASTITTARAPKEHRKEDAREVDIWARERFWLGGADCKAGDYSETDHVGTPKFLLVFADARQEGTRDGFVCGGEWVPEFYVCA